MAVKNSFGKFISFVRAKQVYLWLSNPKIFKKSFAEYHLFRKPFLPVQWTYKKRTPKASFNDKR